MLVACETQLVSIGSNNSLTSSPSGQTSQQSIWLVTTIPDNLIGFRCVTITLRNRSGSRPSRGVIRILNWKVVRRGWIFPNEVARCRKKPNEETKVWKLNKECYTDYSPGGETQIWWNWKYDNFQSSYLGPGCVHDPSLVKWTDSRK